MTQQRAKPPSIVLLGRHEWAALPGDKLSELKNMDTDQMLSLLVESKLVNTVGVRRVSDFIGDFNYLG